MTKINKDLKTNIVKFPKKLNNGEREVEAIVFAALEPLDIDTIESKISKKINGGTNGLSDRIKKTFKYAKYFNL